MEFLSNIPVTDAIDVLIAAVLIYGLILLLRQTRAEKVIEGILILGLIFIAARIFELTLLLTIFRLFLPVFIIALVIIFQEELRRFFEFLGLLPARYAPKKRKEDEHPSIKEIVAAVETLAEERTGALIVLHGTEPLTRHIRGGVPLGGRISRELLLSLFEKHTPAHDGAVIVNRNAVARFAVHLPLSRNTSEAGSYGTRHAAALGLAEKTDALVIVVSEERGAVSLASSGKLTHVADLAELERLISNFYKTVFPDTQKVWKSIIKHNSRDKILALAIAATLWALLKI